MEWPNSDSHGNGERRKGITGNDALWKQSVPPAYLLF